VKIINKPIHYLVLPLLFTFILYIFSWVFFFMPLVEKSITDRKKETIREVTYAIWNILEFYNKQVESGTISLEDAQKMAIRNISQIRYGKEKKDYFWINDFRPYMIMHPYLPKLDNTNLSNYTDQDNRYIFNEMVELVLHNNEGFLTYKWQLKDDSTFIQPKISFIKAYNPWKWIIGTGVYISDIESEIANIKYKLIFVTFLITITIFIVFTFTIRSGIKKEKHLEEIEKKYKKLFDGANDSILILKNECFTDCNSRALELFQCSREDIIGKNVIDFSPEYQDDGQKSSTKALEIIHKTINGESHFFEWTHLRFSGEKFIAEVSLSNIEINNEVFLISFIRDITQRKADEKSLLQAMERAEASDKLKSAFLANMSHEIRTPKNGILGFAQLVQARELEPEKREEYLQIIINKGKQLLQIINDIIDISKIESNQININYHKFSLNEMINELYSFFGLELLNIELKTFKALPDGSDFIISDKTRLVQIMTNLLSNAFKFTEKGFVEFGYHANNNKINLFVKDSGIGVKAEFKDIIFERFRQSDDSNTRKYGGTGLGLSISKGLVEKLGGDISVESDGINGSTFIVEIPVKFVNPVNEKKQSTHNEQEDWKDKKIMVVEDDEISYQYIHELLNETNVLLTHVKTGRKAIEMLKNEKFDLILMDIQLPDIDGNNTTKEIRKFNKQVPIIAQTANAMADDRNKSILAGCNDYLPKPINANALLKTIKAYL